jgi:hypothetical protein
MLLIEELAGASVLVGLERAHGQFGEHDRGRVSGKGWAGNR